MAVALLLLLSSSLSSLLWLIMADVVAAGEILQLTAENFHETVAGKSVFISFVSSSSVRTIRIRTEARRNSCAALLPMQKLE
jgi:hypothetical protein